MQMYIICPNIFGQLWAKPCIIGLKGGATDFAYSLTVTKAEKGKCAFELLREQKFLMFVIYTKFLWIKKENQSEKVQRAK